MITHQDRIVLNYWTKHYRIHLGRSFFFFRSIKKIKVNTRRELSFLPFLCRPVRVVWRTTSSFGTCMLLDHILNEIRWSCLKFSSILLIFPGTLYFKKQFFCAFLYTTPHCLLSISYELLVIFCFFLFSYQQVFILHVINICF